MLDYIDYNYKKACKKFANKNLKYNQILIIDFNFYRKLLTIESYNSSIYFAEAMI